IIQRDRPFVENRLADLAGEARRGHETRTLDCPLEGFGDETCYLSLHIACGGEAFRVWCGGKRAFPYVDADDGEVYRLSSSLLLPDV
ncbi:MAG: hypothetical protein NWR51_12060, partial [Akkermansiaceae bacterium]|nr:hypothetical protein [Akkermansiaceae bacterium]MDP4720549.1 hypothetical protein [Akkermansiaceae bacterium]MDP4779013.1 hypothetical protein [Akkermansiaceae bacterium]MDP4847983.1 hypothetical protein [Akkermansiaceae bacterium]MDP4896558.1 hypothetical protein [Akkermansiaceae bacterium]